MVLFRCQALKQQQLLLQQRQQQQQHLTASTNVMSVPATQNGNHSLYKRTTAWFDARYPRFVKLSNFYRVHS